MSRRYFISVLACLGVGCGFDGGVTVSELVDADLPPFGFIPSNFDPETPQPSGPVVLDCEALVTTDPLAIDEWCAQELPQAITYSQADGSEVVVLAVGSFELSALGRLRIRGSRPAILAVYGDATILGTIDVSAVAEVGGPGSGGGDCSAMAGVRNFDNGSGGGGGGFARAGGNGGAGVLGAAPGAGGAGHGTESLVPLVGGCPGGHGGEATTGGDGGLAGQGGGAFQVSVMGTLQLNGTITSAGSGGRGGTRRDGGGGGGSGGAVLVEASSVVAGADAALVANGGGGGEGGGSTGTTPRDDGEGGSQSSAVAAEGGSGRSNSGGDGCDGGAAGSVAGTGSPGVSGNGGGGGGGGAAGRIRINARTGCTIDGAAVLSPAPSGNGAPGCP